MQLLGLWINPTVPTLGGSLGCPLWVGLQQVGRQAAQQVQHQVLVVVVSMCMCVGVCASRYVCLNRCV